MPPNIVCVSIDSLRADFCSFIEDSEETTPFLTRLSNNATVYESAITPSIWTLPVHSSIFTGLFPPEHGILTGNERLGDHPTFAEQLQGANYTTKVFYSNAWLDTADILRGFSTGWSSQPSNQSNTTIKKKTSDRIEYLSPRIQEAIKKGYLYYQDSRPRKVYDLYSMWRSSETSLTGKDTDGEHDVNSAITEMKDIKEPFCWFLHLNEAHWQYKPPNPYHTAFTDRSISALIKNVIHWQNRVYGSRPNRLKTIAGDITPPTREVETFRNLYRGGIRYCDSLVQKLVESLKSAGVWDDTIFILFGDHGDSFGEKGVFGHHFSMDESLIQVPLLIRDPTGQISPGRVSQPVSLVDIYPTILSLAGADIPENSGFDLSKETRDEAFSYYDISEHDYYTNDYGVDKDNLPPPTQHIVWRSQSEKVIHYPISDEYHAVGENEKELKKLLQEHKAGFNLLDTGENKLSKNVQDRLEMMGYLQE
ncbi:sulfatase [Haloarcula argentinensis]|uniref:Sulfatase-like hydrolase/transferase n=1 Tax=Haloarcula argentinensis TaxID=43776 RepID=A0A847U874_HALAR|nr:sulfatase [Haloarcula argentinensis]NLV11943.1 sulfatase-like hydrolase/transferase [Haloarcula argentinensis]